MLTYYAIFENGNDGITVTFPDIPGCTAKGNSMQDAYILAQEALYQWNKQGKPLPEPSYCRTNGNDGITVTLRKRK